METAKGGDTQFWVETVERGDTRGADEGYPIPDECIYGRSEGCQGRTDGTAVVSLMVQAGPATQFEVSGKYKWLSWRKWMNT